MVQTFNQPQRNKGFWEGANVQGQANVGAAQDTTRVSNPNQITPFGSQTVNYGPDGTPTVTQQYSPEFQNQFQGVNQNLARGMDQMSAGLAKSPGQYRFSQVDSLDTGGLPQLDPLSTEGMTNIQGLSNQGLFDLNPIDTSQLTERQTMPTVGAQSMVAEALREREAPRFDRRREQAENDLLVRGFNPGTEGYDARMDEVNRAQNDFNLGLTSLSGQEQSRLFDLESGLRGQELDEQLADFGTTSGARGQMFGERESMFGSQLAQRGQEFGERRAIRDSQMDERRQALTEALSNWETQTGDRGREIDEAITARQLPMQEFAQMQSLTPNMPQFQGFTGAQVDPGDYQGALGQRLQEDLGHRDISMRKKNANRGALFDIGGAILGAL